MPKLEYTLEDLLAAADAAEPNQVKTKLGGGLTINLRRDGTLYRLLIWRASAYPSFREWNEICAHWPYPIGAPNPHQGIYQGRMYLQGTIPAHPKTSAMETANGPRPQTRRGSQSSGQANTAADF